jgi:hypothetical protein
MPFRIRLTLPRERQRYGAVAALHSHVAMVGTQKTDGSRDGEDNESMLLFLDESYEKDEAGDYRLSYAGFAVDERRYRGLVAAVYQAKQRHIVQSISGMDDSRRIEIARTQLLQDLPPERAEVKANKLMGTRQVKRLEEHGFAPGITLVSDMLRALRDADATVFGVLSNPPRVQDVLNPTVHVSVEIIRLLERVELWMKEQHADDMVSVIPDTIDSYKHNLSSSLADFLFRSAQGKAMRHVVVTPFWVDSSVTIGSQLADIVAYLILNTMRPATRRLPLHDLWRIVASMEFSSVDGVTRGIRRVKRRKDQQAGADAR